MHKLLFILFFFLINPVFAIEFNGKFIQGHFIIGKTNPNSQILIDKRKVKVSKDGYFACWSRPRVTKGPIIAIGAIATSTKGYPIATAASYATGGEQTSANTPTHTQITSR